MTIDVALALGAGGVKGFAHLGVLRALDQAGIRIRAIAGTSIGGMLGAVYAAGYTPDEIERYLARVNQARLYQYRRGDGPAMYGNSGIGSILEDQLGELAFEDLAIPFAVTAVDIDTGQLLALQSGRILDAVLATIAVPGVFPPAAWRDRTLLDGGILDPVPVGLARKLAPGLPVIAVVLTAPLERWADQSLPGRTGWNGRIQRLGNLLSQWRYVQALGIFLRSINIASNRISELKLSLDAPEVIIRPAVERIGLLDRVDIRNLRQRGEAATTDVLDQILSSARRVEMGPDTPFTSRRFLTYDDP